MINGPTPTGTPAPAAGDIIVTREARSAPRFTVRQFPGAVQLSAATRDEAVRLGRTFAQAHGVDIWYADNGVHRLLEAYRARPAAPRRQANDSS